MGPSIDLSISFLVDHSIIGNDAYISNDVYISLALAPIIMKTHTTNYHDTFIAVADDCPAQQGETPPLKGDKRTVAVLQFELISRNPYCFTSDDVLFKVYAERKELTCGELGEARKAFFSKGQPCLRTSPLAKRYGWGIHCDEAGKVALYSVGSKEYEAFSNDGRTSVVKAVRSGRR